MLGLHPGVGGADPPGALRIYGFTGTRHGMTARQRYEVHRILTQALQDNKQIRARHGDCVGADVDFDVLCADYGIHRTAHPPLDPKLRAFCECEVILKPQDFMVRNHAIVDSSKVMIACPATHREIVRSGTWATVRYAHLQLVPCVIVFPDGSTRVGPE